jgi:SSS family solute:Na+ symporter
VLLTLVIAYLLVTIAIGLMAAKRVKTSADFAIAGRGLPLVMIVTTTFATCVWVRDRAGHTRQVCQ